MTVTRFPFALVATALLFSATAAAQEYHPAATHTWVPYQRPAASVPTFQTAVDGDAAFLAGTFEGFIRRATGGLAVLDNTGRPLTGWPAVGGGQITAFARDALGGLFIGGNFTTVNGAARPAIARIDAAGRWDPTFAPPVSGHVAHLVVSGNTLYAAMSSLSSFEPGRIVAMDAVTGARRTFTQEVPVSVIDVIASDQNGGVVAAGRHVNTNPQTVHIVAFNPSGAVRWSLSPGWMYAISRPTADATRLFVAVPNSNSDTRSVVYAVDLESGAFSTAPITLSNTTCGIDVCFPVHTMTVRGEVLYLAGALHSVNNVARNGSAAVNVTTGEVLPWQARHAGAGLTATEQGIVALGSTYTMFDAETGQDLTTFAASGVVNSAIGFNGRLFLGGPVRGAGGFVGRPAFAKVALTTGQPLEWTPRPAIPASVSMRTVAAAAGFVVFGGAEIVNGAEGAGFLAAYSAATGDRVWTVSVNAPVHQLTIDGARLFVGGRFSQIDGQTRSALAAFDWTGSTFAIAAWGPALAFSTAASVAQIRVAGDIVLLRGSFAAVSGVARAGLAAVHRTTGDVLSWNPQRPAATWLDVGGGAIWTVSPGTGGLIESFDLLSGARRNWFPLSLSGISEKLMYADGRVYLSSGTVLDAVTGAVINLNIGWDAVFPCIATPRGALGCDEYAFYPAVVPPFGPPTALAAEVVGTQVTLTWTPAPGLSTNHVIEVGSAPGLANLGVLQTGSGQPQFSATGPPGAYYLRVRGANASGVGPPSNDILIVLGPNGCGSPPAPPGTLVAQTDGFTAMLTWAGGIGGSAATHFEVEAGSGPGLADLARLNAGARPSFTGRGPAGTYFVRVRAVNACGASGPSNEVIVRLGPVLPGAPTGLTGSTGAGGTVTLAWSPPAGDPPDDYLIEAGTVAGSFPFAIVVRGLGYTVNAVPAGTYYVRVRARNVVGAGAPTEVLVLTVR